MPTVPALSTKSHGLLLPDLSAEEATALDREIDQHIQSHGRQTVELYLALGRCLAKLHAGRGYKALGFQHWKDYLATKPDFGRTYMSFILKVGEAAEQGHLALDPFMAEGLNGTLLLTYAQMTDQPDKIQDLIAATWPEIKGKGIRDAEKALRAYVDAHWETYRKHAKPMPHEPHTGGWQSIWESDFRGLDVTGQSAYIQEMWAFLEHHDHGSHPVPTP
jgi:hypothetical protein